MKFQIDPNTQILIGVAVAVLTLAAHGSVALPLGVPAEVGQYITSWANFILQIYAVVGPILLGYSSSKPGPLAPQDPPVVVAATKAAEASDAADAAVKAQTTKLPLVVGALLALGLVAMHAGPARADSQDLINGLKSQHGGKPFPPIFTPPTPAPTNADGSPQTVIQKIVADNKALLAQLEGDMRTILSLFGTGDEAIAEALQYPDLQDGNGHDCAVQGKRFTSVIHDHPLAITGDFINDLQNLRTVSAAAQKICNATSCQAVFGDLSAQVSKSVSAVNSKVGAVTSVIPGAGAVGGIVGAVGSAASSVNVFSLLCGDLATITLVPPTIADPTPSPTPSPAAIATPAATPAPLPSPSPSATPVATPTPSPSSAP